MRIVLISTYEMGRQPFGLASPAAWLRGDGHEVTAADLSCSPMPWAAVQEAELLAFFLPMHTATRLFQKLIDKVRAANPRAHLCGYGLYAPLNDALLRRLGVQTVIGGEFEQGLCDLARRLSVTRAGELPYRQPEPLISMARQQFRVPDRTGLPALGAYAQLIVDGATRRVGYTEASRGCKHLCRHCPVVPVYRGLFRIVQAGSRARRHSPPGGRWSRTHHLRRPRFFQWSGPRDGDRGGAESGVAGPHLRCDHQGGVVSGSNEKSVLLWSIKIQSDLLYSKFEHKQR